ncbi:hypothetical protein BC940DRAFT_337883 [Gongronella butleri]|nr:hypothetical protein BC940DRAFT_337883 [Gongronella butleri]
MIDWQKSETALLWLIVFIPVVLSLALFMYVRWALHRMVARQAIEDEERVHAPPTTLPCTIVTEMDMAPPPSYLASHRDRVYHLPPTALTSEKPPGYPCPPSYDYAIGPDDVPLSDIQKRIIDQRHADPLQIVVQPL